MNGDHAKPPERDDTAPPEFSIPDHDLLRRIGRGAYGEVWLARSMLGTMRAVKVVFRKNFKHDRPYDREFEGIRKFEPVSRAHAGFVDILQVGRNEAEAYFYCVMELADAAPGKEPADATAPPPAVSDWESYAPRTLASEARDRGQLPFQECLKIGVALSSALHHLHEHGLVHRDVKPANVVFVGGEAKLADIGLVTEIREDMSFVGSSGYMAPEGPGGPQADLYSLGKVLYEISTGLDRQEYPALPGTLLEATGHRELLELNEVVIKACADNPAHRHKTAEALRADLLLLQGGKSVKRLRVLEARLALITRVAISAAAVVLIAGFIAFQVIRERQREAQERQRQVGAAVANGTQSMEAGDMLNALSSFSEALRLEEDEPARQRTHRLRLATTLARAPRIVQMGFHANPVYGGEFCPEGENILWSDRAGQVNWWNIRTGELTARSPRTNEFAGRAHFSGDGRWIVTAGLGSLESPAPTNGHPIGVRVWNATNLEPVAAFTPPGATTVAQFNSAGDQVVAAGTDGAATVWEWRTGRTICRLQTNKQPLRHAAFSHDGRRVVTASHDGSAWVWDVATAQVVTRLRHGNWVFHATFSPDDRQVATASFDRTARLWDATTGREVYAQPLAHNDGVQTVEFSPNGRLLLTASLDSTVRLWDARTGRPAGPTLRHNGHVMSACFNADGRLAFTVCFDGVTRVWQLPANPLPPISPDTYSPDGTRFAHWSGSNLQVLEASSSNHIAACTPALRPAKVVLNHSGTRLLTLARINPDTDDMPWQAQFWDANTGEPLGGAFAAEGAFAQARFSRRGNRLLIFSTQEVAVLSIPERARLAVMVFTNQTEHEANFDHAGARLVVADGATARVFDASSGRELIEPLVHPASVRHAEFSPDGALLVTAFADLGSLDEGAALVWDAATGRPVGRPLRHRDGVLWAAFSPDGRRVITAGEEFTALIWDARTGRQLIPRPLQHFDQVTSAVFSDDGRWVATASVDQSARVWDAATGIPVTPALMHPEFVGSVRFVTGGRQLLTVGFSGATRLWGLPSTTWPAEDMALLAGVFSGQKRDEFSTMTPYRVDDLKRDWESLRAKLSEKPPGGF